VVEIEHYEVVCGGQGEVAHPAKAIEQSPEKTNRLHPLQEFSAHDLKTILEQARAYRAHDGLRTRP
jgi:hypothetical protein